MQYSKYHLETHPFDDFIPENAEYLIVGTFPTPRRNIRYEFYYSSETNSFWPICEEIFEERLVYFDGIEAVNERKTLLQNNNVGITDMIKKCYRYNGKSGDENLYPIMLNDIIKLIEKHKKIKRLILTSRTDIFGASGLLKTYFLQKDLRLTEPIRREDNIYQTQFIADNRKIEVYIALSPSARNKTDFKKLVEMYGCCLF